MRYFVFNVLPFGLSSACYIFAKMFRPFVRRWREFGQAADGISGDAHEHVACNNSMLDVLPDNSGYGTHSLKRGAATAAVNSGVVTSQLDSYAGWKCADSQHSYVELDLNNKLAVSRSLNL